MASAIIRSVAVHSRPAHTIHLTDCICIHHGVSSECSSPYRPTRLPPVAPYKPSTLDDESFDLSDSKTPTPISPLCACLNCTKTAPFCFDRFQSDIVSASTAVELAKEKTQHKEHLAAIVEHISVEKDAAALGALSKKQSPLFGRKQCNDSPTAALAQSFSLRTEEPFYAQQVLVGPNAKQGVSGEQNTTNQKHKIDHNAVEAISMSVGVANGAAISPNNGTDINRNNGQLRNGTIMTSANTEKREHLYKILVIGELGTGKTSFIKRYVHQFFSQNYRATIGVDFALKVLHWDPNTTVRLQLWDIAGQERFGNMTRVYYKEAVGAFIVFDVTRSGTFDCVSKWKEDLDSKVQLPDGSPIPCILLANKCDQEKQGIVTSPEKMDEYVRENGFAGWYETSAKENINIDEAARALVNKILLNDKLISAADLADSEKFNLNSSVDQSSSENKGKCYC
ncbi:ras and EF-hand domain-containing protein homolog isoform X2 [Zeugodacus cucurbitae]|uniref:Ras-related protein Rab-32 n=1 Tax=Zeugodacus cucurbitae TaxID=28588 RepID=A0A0A1XRI0_ZEUCU|nr:ras and EF-hand domain-containing protein homolog isoform X2 [Zeugodacus cucurbitae]XP_028899266.2 ras and EF-hand domain-containing protein homolog isoform X2 [Zeugodacus cucurbitae]XP_028899267.2 ras and EF-hand domain-containing protein homolog isoform X2 [Zeugodacus cucurbitae]XP_054090948.1 ras and EF-hand domain-containing protein homolog isoform X2 [Zeugodacus cucurbitae]